MFDDKQDAQVGGEPEDMFSGVDGAPANLPGAAPMAPSEPPAAPDAPTEPLPEPPAAPPSEPAPEIKTSPAPAPGMFDQASPTPSAPSSIGSPLPPPAHTRTSSGRGGAKMIVLLMLSVIVLGLAVYLVYILVFANAEPTSPSDIDIPTFDEFIPDPAQLPPEKAPEPVIPPEQMDSDGDGLSDAEEATYGTDATEPDTDSDGLGDREEVLVYKTDPLDADTDDDGFSDGMEVASGYNPNGDGKLLEVPSLDPK
jgi:hypothetical protein